MKTLKTRLYNPNNIRRVIQDLLGFNVAEDIKSTRVANGKPARDVSNQERFNDIAFHSTCLLSNAQMINGIAKAAQLIAKYEAQDNSAEDALTDKQVIKAAAKYIAEGQNGGWDTECWEACFHPAIIKEVDNLEGWDVSDRETEEANLVHFLVK